MTQHQPWEKFTKEHRPLKLEELKLGLKYIHVEPILTPSEMKKTKFHVFMIEPQRAKQSEESYLDYKKTIKKWTEKGVLYIKDDKPKQEEKKQKPDLFNT